MLNLFYEKSSCSILRSLVGPSCLWRMEVAMPDPHTFIQRKGTDVCMDVHCECGHHGHVDCMFAYYYRCIECGRVYEFGHEVSLKLLENPPEDLQCVVYDGKEEFEFEGSVDIDMGSQRDYGRIIFHPRHPEKLERLIMAIRKAADVDSDALDRAVADLARYLFPGGDHAPS